MSKVLHFEQCPNCATKGKDRSSDNLGVYADGGAHCFSCGYHRNAKFQLNFLIQEKVNDQEKIVLPRDFTREVPAEGWKWLLQYGLSYSYWKPFTGYTPAENRIILTVGQPIRFSQGRALTVGERKWKVYGSKRGYVDAFGEQLSGEVVLVEDLISAHKVGHVTPCIALFGTNIEDDVVKKLQDLKRPVALWLDDDQYTYLPKKINRLRTLLTHPVRYIRTTKDPKSYSIDEIKEILA